VTRLPPSQGRELFVDEVVTVAAASIAASLDARRARPALASLTRALRGGGWHAEPLAAGGRRYRRSRTKTLDVSGFLPAERTNRFAPPSSIRAPLPGGVTLAVLLEEHLRVVLDGPSNAIGETFPDGERQRGPGGGDRIALGAVEFGEPIEFDVRSAPFRNPLLVKAVDVTLWTPFAWMLAITTSLISDRVREFITGWIKRLLQRIRRRRRPRRRVASGARRPGK
jgi:hypothetical protein